MLKVLNEFLKKGSLATIGFYFLLAFIFFLSFDHQLNTYLLGAFMFLTVLDPDYRANYTIRNIPTFSKIIFFSLLFLYTILVLSLFHFGNIEVGVSKLFHKITIVFLPIIFIGYEPSKIDIKKILGVFVLGVFFSSLVCIVLGLVKIIDFTDAGFTFNHHVLNDTKTGLIKAILIRKSYLSYDFLSRFIHPSYLAMFINFSVAIIYYFIKKDIVIKKRMVLLVSLIVFFELVLFLLVSRAGFIGGLLIVFSIVCIEIFTFNKQWSVFVLVVFIALSSYLFVKNDKIQTNITELIGITQNGLEKDKHYDDRIYIWNGAIDIIQNNFWIGVGISNTDSMLMESYVRQKYREGIRFDYNAHNQFLDIWINIGFIGTFMLLSIFILMFIYSIRERYFLLWAFSLIMFINLLFESMLNRFAGVAFFALLLSVLIFHQEKQKVK